MPFLVDARRWFLHLFGVPKDRDNDERDERQHSELAIAICGLTCELRALREQREASLVTKCDLAQTADALRMAGATAEARILKAIKAGSDADIKAATANLSASTDALQNAVNNNK